MKIDLSPIVRKLCYYCNQMNNEKDTQPVCKRNSHGSRGSNTSA